MKTEIEFNDIVLEVNFDKDDWQEIESIAEHFRVNNYFDADPFKCAVGAGIIYVVLKNDKNALEKMEVEDSTVH